MDDDYNPMEENQPSVTSSTSQPLHLSLDDIELGVNEEILSNNSRKNSRKSSSKISRKNSSKVWKHFDKYEENKVKMAKCRKCKFAYKTHGTTNLQKHLAFLCPYRKMNFHTDVARNDEFEQAVFRRIYGEALILHNMPFRFVEYKGFRKLHSYLNLAVRHVSRNTIKTDMLDIYETHKEKIKKELEDFTSRICLTSDMWTSIKSNGYMTVTAHFVGNDWVVQKRVLVFRHVPPPHDGQSVGERLISYLKEWGIDRKVLTLTLDNTSYNNVVIDLLKQHMRLTNSLVCRGEFLHIRCGAHILNLIVQDGLRIIDASVERIRESVKYMKGSELRKSKFMECAQELGLDSTKLLLQDVATRWNSTYLMLERALYFKLAYQEFEIFDKHYVWCLPEIEWERVQKNSNFLKPFYDMTKLFSGSKYPTSNLYFMNVWKIQMLIKEELMNEVGPVKKIAEGMKSKFDKYWSEYSPILSIAFALDPRYKLKFVELAYTKVDDLSAGWKVNNLKRQMNDLFEEYLNVAPPKVSLSSSSHVIPTSKVDEILEILILKILSPYILYYVQEFDSIQSQGERERSQSQLEQYLKEPVMDRKRYLDLDLLTYWKQNDKYPDLARMARDVLSIPITTVASESVFSHGGRIFGKYRTTMLPTNAEAVLCGRDWLDDYSSEDEELEDEFAIDQQVERFDID